MITAQQLRTIGIGPEWVDPLNQTFAKFGIDDVKKQAAFLGQCAHECNHFKTLEENLNYKAATLQKLSYGVIFATNLKPFRRKYVMIDGLTKSSIII